MNTEHKTKNRSVTGMKPRLILSLLALLAFSHMVHAELVFDISEQIISPTQTNLLISISGSVDTDGLTLLSPNSSTGGSAINPNTPYLSTQAGISATYTLPGQLPSLGSDIAVAADSYTGALILYDAFLSNGLLGVPENYVSEAPLEATMTFNGRNFDDFSLVAGESYTVSWAEGTANEDSLTVNIVPEPSSILLIGTASGLLALARQKRPYTWREK